MALQWVESGGGPPLAAPQAALGQWNGVSDDGPVETWGDYGRACSVAGYLGTVAIGDREGLVFGDEPASTTFLAQDLLFLHWCAADSETEIVAAARKALQDGVAWDEDEDLLWDVPGPVVLFDPTFPGAELEPDNHPRHRPHPQPVPSARHVPH